MSKPRGKDQPTEKSEKNDQGSKSQADHPDERLQDLLRGRFPEGLPPSQSLNEENPEDVKDRKPKKRGKKRLPVQKQLPKPKEK